MNRCVVNDADRSKYLFVSNRFTSGSELTYRYLERTIHYIFRRPAKRLLYVQIANSRRKAKHGEHSAKRESLTQTVLDKAAIIGSNLANLIDKVLSNAAQ